MSYMVSGLFDGTKMKNNTFEKKIQLAVPHCVFDCLERIKKIISSSVIHLMISKCCI